MVFPVEKLTRQQMLLGSLAPAFPEAAWRR
jgi:hypothetical protein